MSQPIRLLIVALTLLTLTACAGKQGAIQVDQTIAAFGSRDYGVHIHKSLYFTTQGAPLFSGRPDGFGAYAYSISLNLKSIQEGTANKVLASIYDHVIIADTGEGIVSEITNFSYNWSFSLAAKPQVSFHMNIYWRVNGEKHLYKAVDIKDFNGGEEQVLMGGALFGLLGAALTNEADKRSQLVTNTTIKAVYSIYKKEFPIIAKSHAEKASQGE